MSKLSRILLASALLGVTALSSNEDQSHSGDVFKKSKYDWERIKKAEQKRLRKAKKK